MTALIKETGVANVLLRETGEGGGCLKEDEEEVNDSTI
jgi:hypothetical protein